MNFKTKALIGSLMLAGLCSAAQAAYFERVDYQGAGGYSALTDGDAVSAAAVDLSAPAGDVALFGAQVFNSPLMDGSLEHSYAADASLNFSASGTDLWMSLSQSLTATASGALGVASHRQDAFVDLSAVTLRIAGAPGEAAGSPVNVGFAGSASALYDFSNVVSGGYLGLGLSVSRGNDVLGEYLWDVTQTGDQAVNFSFAGSVGEEFTLSGFMLSGAGLASAGFAQSASAYALVDAGAALSGSFTIAAVPEPETYAMLLAGLGLIGTMVRRRKAG